MHIFIIVMPFSPHTAGVPIEFAHIECTVQVRAAAYTALAAYPMEVLETLEALRPLQQYVELLKKETDPRARAECQGLVGRALAHEHSRRRRYVLAGTCTHCIRRTTD